MSSAETVAATSGGTWELFKDDQDLPIVANEINTAGNTQTEKELISAEVRHLMREALLGRLIVDEHIKKIRTDPLLYELRWKIGDRSAGVPKRMWRLYFGWHRRQGMPLRLALKFSRKPWGVAGEVAQRLDILEAAARHRVWHRRQYP